MNGISKVSIGIPFVNKKSKFRAKEKGDLLERAVELVQRAILKSDPRMDGTKFSIECKKVIIVEGVRHEVDVFVKTLAETDYESVWIFECKNWNTPVGKNEVIILSEKVKVLGATRGYLVARTFSKDAVAQVKSDIRLKLIECADDFVSSITSMRLLHLISEPMPIQLSIKQRDIAPVENPSILDWKNTVFTLNNEPINLASFLHDYVKDMVEDDKKQNHAKYRFEGTHERTQRSQFIFKPGEFKFDGNDVEYIIMTVQFFVTVKNKKIISKFELKGQGRAYTFEPIRDLESGKDIVFSIVQRI